MSAESSRDTAERPAPECRERGYCCGPNAYCAVCDCYDAIWEGEITYTLASEPGSSLRAVGYEVDEELPPRGWGGGRDRYEENLLGEAQRPTEAKIRWRKALPS